MLDNLVEARVEVLSGVLFSYNSFKLAVCGVYLFSKRRRKGSSNFVAYLLCYYHF